MSLATDIHAFLVVGRGPRDLLNGGPPGAIFPGFFIRVYRNEGYDDLLGHGDQADRQITLEQALAIGDAFDAAAGVGPRTRQALVATAAQLAQDIGRSIEAAELAIERLPRLRTQLDQMRAAQSALAPDSRPWYRLTGSTGLTIRYVRASSMEDAASKWQGAGLPTISGPYESVPPA